MFTRSRREKNAARTQGEYRQWERVMEERKPGREEGLKGRRRRIRVHAFIVTPRIRLWPFIRGRIERARMNALRESVRNAGMAEGEFHERVGFRKARLRVLRYSAVAALTRPGYHPGDRLSSSFLAGVRAINLCHTNKTIIT